MSATVTPAREIAYDAFIKVMDFSVYPDDAVEDLISKKKISISRLDRSFIKELLFGGLRWYSKIYWILQKTSKRDLQTVSPEIRAALLLGAYQIFYMDRVPDRAAVNESVEYVRKKSQASAVTFVNGILRAIARRAEYFTKPDKDRQPCDYYALQYAHPRWMVERWSKRFHADRLKELLSSNNQPPPYSVRINTLKVPLEETQELRNMFLKEEKNHSDKKALRSCLQLQNSPNFEAGSLFQRGFFSVQDESSQLIANLLNPQENELIFDACAGPGGKTNHIFELSKGRAHIIAIEKDEKQFIKGKENSIRLGHSLLTEADSSHVNKAVGIEWIKTDFLKFKPKVLADKILLDAPCSGLGVLRRHPEGKWHKSLALIPALSTLQRQLIRHALEILRPGGELTYSVCSYEPEETIDHLAWVEEEFKGQIEMLSPLNRIPDYYKRFVTREHVLMIYSGNKDDMDGFGAFILRKKSL